METIYVYLCQYVFNQLILSIKKNLFEQHVGGLHYLHILACYCIYSVLCYLFAVPVAPEFQSLAQKKKQKRNMYIVFPKSSDLKIHSVGSSEIE